MGEEVLIDAHEVARRLHVSRATVYRMFHRGTIPGYKIDTTYRFLWSEIQEALHLSHPSHPSHQ